MTEFKETQMRKMCRNPRCGSKLPEPVSNPREAFCTRGCYNSFYLHRCIVCEKPIERTTASRKICKKSKCRSALKVGLGIGRYHGNQGKRYPSPKNAELMQEVPLPQRPASASEPVSLATKAGAQRRIVKFKGSALDFCASCARDSDLIDLKAGAGWVTFCRDCRDRYRDRNIVLTVEAPKSAGQPWLQKGLAKSGADKLGWRWQRMLGPNGEIREDDDWELFGRDSKMVARVRQEGAGYWELARA